MSENFGGNECCDAEDDSGVDWGLYVVGWKFLFVALHVFTR